MNFYTISDLSDVPKSIWNSLSDNGKVVITDNGKPAALMLGISDGNFEETMLAIKQAQAMIAVNNMRKKAALAGLMSDEEINTEIKEARRETW